MPETKAKKNDQSSTQNIVAENWLLPEITGDHVVSVEKKHRSSGFHPRLDTKTDEAKKISRPFAMTEKKLLALEQEAKELGFAEGRAEGYKKGYAEGEERAKALGHEQTIAQQQQLTQLIDAITVLDEQQSKQIKKTLVNVISQIAQQLCYRELHIDNTVIETIVSDAIDALPIGEKHITFVLNPNDLILLNGINGFIKPHWVLQSDDTTQSGGCRLETENSLIDFTVSDRLKTIIEKTFNEKVEANDFPSEPSSIKHPNN